MDHSYEDIIISVSEEDHVVISTNKKNDRSVTDSTHLLKPSLPPVISKHMTRFPSHEGVLLAMCGSYLCLWWLLS